MATENVGKSAAQSKTIWFGVACVALGIALGVVDVLAQSSTMDAAVISTIAGILTVILRFKTKVALILGVDDPTTPEDESKGEKPATDGGFATMKTMLMVLVLALTVIGLSGCGSVFTVTKGELVTLDIKPTAPSYAIVSIAGAETCRVNNPQGTIALLNVCPDPLVSTMTPAGEPTCVPNPCAIGLDFVFLPNGMTACK